MVTAGVAMLHNCSDELLSRTSVLMHHKTEDDSVICKACMLFATLAGD
jgi:hypothetical protein